MRPQILLLASCLILIPTLSQSATKSYSTKNRITFIENGVKRYKRQIQHHQFRMEVLSDRHGLKVEKSRSVRPFIEAEKGERYAIRLHNPLPVRVAVNLTVDGINSISGEPSGLSDGSKWIIPPHSFITIRGWQVNQNDLRRFYFTEKPKSYAKWRSEDFDKDLSVNCGVIGAAYFWNKRALQAYYNQHPTILNTPPSPYWDGKVSSSLKKSQVGEKAPYSRRNLREEVDEQEAGTGMGEREAHLVHTVKFHTNQGMYKLKDAVVIYYDFKKPQIPNPFPGLSYAPEMPN